MNKKQTLDDWKKVLENIMKTLGDLEKCQQQKCEPQVRDGIIQRLSVKKRMEPLLTEFIKDKNFEKFTKSTDALQQELLTSDITKALMTCTLEQCEIKARRMLKAMIESKKYDCTQENKRIACDITKDALAILKKKRLQSADFIEITRLVNRSSEKTRNLKNRPIKMID